MSAAAGIRAVGTGEPDLKPVAAPAWPCVSADELDAMQLAQFRHDETYHREISRLTVKERLTHMTLHFAKYAGYLAAGADDRRFRRTVTDLFVIGLSTLNGLNVQIHSAISEMPRANDTSEAELTRSVTVLAGHMASACERLDHLEDFPYRQTLRDAALAMVALALAAAQDRGWVMADLVSERLLPVKEKSIFHGRL